MARHPAEWAFAYRKGPHVVTLVGTGLFDFGDVNGVGDVGRSHVRTARAAPTLKNSEN